MLDKFGALQMAEVHFPTTGGRTLIFARYPSRSQSRGCSWRNWGGNCPGNRR